VTAAPEAPRRPRRRLVTEFDAHEKSVLLPLCLVGFFTNYDTGLLSLAAPDIAAGLDVSMATFGIAVALIRLAALGSVATLRLADRWGRRPMLLLSVLAFTLLTGLTAVAWGLVAFVVFQLLARLFLATEETLAAVVLTEELRPDRRGAGIGLLGIISTAGFGLVALLMLAVDSTPLGWRLFYVAALLPLGVVVYLRRNLGETRAYLAAEAAERLQPTWWPDLEPEQRRHLRRLLAVLALVGMLGTSAFFYAADLAQNDYGWRGLFTVIVFAAAPTTLIGYLVGGRMSDRFGRKPVLRAAVLAFSAGAVLVFTGQPGLYVPGFFLLAGADAAVQAVRSAFAGELFPTEVRATLASLAGAVTVAAGSAGLLLAGILAPLLDPQITVLGIAAACVLSVCLLRPLPETAGIDVLGPRSPMTKETP
jgi:MFS family permease